MTEDAQIIQDLGLLSWKTAEVGFRRGWIDAESIEDLAVRSLDQTATTDSDLADLAVTKSLCRSEIEDLLAVVADRLDPATDEETAVKRWLLGRLIGLRRRSSIDEDLLERVEEIRVEFGYPEELDGVGRYDFTPEERAADLASSDRARSTTSALDFVIASLRTSLTERPR